jgi:glycosyltransferase involved in cell wall biosynthesis
MIDHISAVMIVKNGEKYLDRCLTTLRDFKEVIILENGSTDQTNEIAKTFPNVKIFHDKFIGFGPTKQLACSYASNDWIFSIDCDEFLSAELISELKNRKLEENQVGEIYRLNYLNRKLINGCGWGNDYIVRLFNRKTAHFTDKLVHESIDTKNCTIVRLKGEIHHFTFANSAELLQKMISYASLFAKQNRFKRRTSIVKAICKSYFTFLKFYLFKRGFLFGKEGYMIAKTSSNNVFYKYYMLLEENQNLSISVIFYFKQFTPKILKTIEFLISENKKINELILISEKCTKNEIPPHVFTEYRMPVKLVSGNIQQLGQSVIHEAKSDFIVYFDDSFEFYSTVLNKIKASVNSLTYIYSSPEYIDQNTDPANRYKDLLSLFFQQNCSACFKSLFVNFNMLFFLSFLL